MKTCAFMLGGLLLSLALGLYMTGYRFNLIHSYPLGFYQLSKTSQYQQGDLVVFCPPPGATIEQALKREYLKYGTCKSGSTPLIKKIMAISGDHLSFDGVVRKNGKPLARFLVHSADSHHRTLPKTVLTVATLALSPKTRFKVRLSPYSLSKSHRLMMDIDQYSHCIYQVHPTTIEQVIKNESNFRPLAINVNALPNQKPPRITQPKTKQEAIQLANYYVSLGHSVDLGLMQINSKNLAPFGVSIADMFTPCKNIHVGSSILYQSYQRALKINPKPSIALQIALSYYNTGSPHRGFRNGYVKKYVKNDIPKRVLTAPSSIPTQGLYD